MSDFRELWESAEQIFNESNELDVLKAMKVKVSGGKFGTKDAWVIKNTKTGKVLAKSFNGKFSNNPILRGRNGEVDSNNHIKRLKDDGVKLNDLKFVSLDIVESLNESERS